MENKKLDYFDREIKKGEFYINSQVSSSSVYVSIIYVLDIDKSVYVLEMSKYGNITKTRLRQTRHFVPIDLSQYKDNERVKKFLEHDEFLNAKINLI